MAIALNYAIRSDVGLVRSNNQDSGYAGPDLLVVADGMGGHAGGDVASSLAIGELVSLDGEAHGADDALAHLRSALFDAHQQLLQRVNEEPTLAGMGTTVTALLRTGNRLALAHIGDSRAYFLRDGNLAQITHDHTFVQTLVDEGRLSQEEAEHHPQRSVLMRVLSDLIEDAEPDLSMREARVGDRYMICSDGLSGVVSFDTLRETLSSAESPTAVCETLVNLALRGGAPDNVTCIVADIVGELDTGGSVPAVVGAASRHAEIRTLAKLDSSASAAERAAALTQAGPATSEAPGAAAPASDADELTDDAVGRSKRRIALRSFALVAVVAVLAGGVFGAWRWSQTQFFVAGSDGSVAIYRGLPQDLGPLTLSSVEQVASDVPLADLPQYWRERVDQSISAEDQDQAAAIVQTLREKAVACRQLTATNSTAATPASTPAATPARTSTSSGSGTPDSNASTTPIPSLTGSVSPTTSPSHTAAASITDLGAGDACEGSG